MVRLLAGNRFFSSSSQMAFAEASVDQSAHCRGAFLSPEQLREVKTRFEEAATHHADLQAQLLVQSQTNTKTTELLMQGLDSAIAERAQLKEDIDKLYTDLHALTAKMLKEQLGVRERVQREGVQGRGGQSRLAYRPTVEDAERQPTHVCEMSHQSLAELAMLGNHSAHRERLLREVMAVDGVSWEKAHEMLGKFDEYNEKYYWLESLPYRVGIPFNVLCVIGFTLMVFSKPVAVWYAENIAAEELPEGVTEVSEMTTNQVGAWTWGWNEPMIGVATFVLLCCQFARAQVSKMHMKTYGEHLLQWRAKRLARRFPEYDSSMVKAWAKHMPRVNGFMPVYEKYEGTHGPCSGL